MTTVSVQPTTSEQDEREAFMEWHNETQGRIIYPQPVAWEAWQHQQKQIDAWIEKSIERERHLAIANAEIDSLQAKLKVAVNALEKQQGKLNELRFMLWHNAKTQAAYEKMRWVADQVTEGIDEALAEINRLQSKSAEGE